MFESPLFHKSLAEFAGTFVIVFAGCGALMLRDRFPNLIPSAVIPLIFGLAVMVMILAVGPISGAHFNPAVTLAFVAAKRFPAALISVYLFSQCAGGLSAAGLLMALRKI